MSDSGGPTAEDDGAWSLSIAEVAQRSGVSVTDLRNWEARHGFPTPKRTQGGQRRYREEDSALVEEVVRHRRGGLSVAAAIATVVASAERAQDGSLFAAICRRHPELQPQTLTKRVLLALTWAVEDHVSSTAEAVLLVGAFQEPGFYRKSAPRWRDLTETAGHTIVFGAERSGRRQGGTLVEVAIPDGSPMRREWALISDGPAAACVVARERPGQRQRRDSDRLFEAVWTIDATAVRSASYIAANLADEPATSPAWDYLSIPPPAAPPELRTLDTLVHRTLGYLVGIQS